MFCAFPLVHIPKLSVSQEWTHEFPLWTLKDLDIMQLLDEVEHNIMNYQCRGLSYLPKPKAEIDNTITRFDNS